MYSSQALWIVLCTLLVLYRSYKFRTHAITINLCFAVLKIINFVAIKLEVLSLRRDVFYIQNTQGLDLYTSAKFRAFNNKKEQTDQLPQLLQRYGTVCWTILGKRIILIRLRDSI